MTSADQLRWRFLLDPEDGQERLVALLRRSSHPPYAAAPLWECASEAETLGHAVTRVLARLRQAGVEEVGGAESQFPQVERRHVLVARADHRWLVTENVVGPIEPEVLYERVRQDPSLLHGLQLPPAVRAPIEHASRQAVESVLPIREGNLGLFLHEWDPTGRPVLLLLGFDEAGKVRFGKEQPCDIAPAGDPARVASFLSAWANAVGRVLARREDSFAEAHLAPSDLAHPDLAQQPDLHEVGHFEKALLAPCRLGGLFGMRPPAFESRSDALAHCALTPHTSAMTLFDSTGDDLAGIEQLEALRELTIEMNQLRNLEPLRGLTQLQRLAVKARVEDASSVGGLVGLRELRWEGGPLPSLERLTNLEVLHIGHAAEDHEWLRQLPRLRDLDLRFASLTDVSPLAGLAHLERLNLFGTTVEDVTPLARLRSLTHVHLPKSATGIDVLREALPDCEFVGD